MVQAPRRRFDVDEYHWMGRVGILSEDDRVELIKGEIVELPPIGSKHASTVTKIATHAITLLGETACVRVQNPTRLRAHSEPEPDIAIVKPRSDRYSTSHPTPDDVLQLIEVVDTTARYDREKLALYARSGVPEVWHVDLQAERVEMHRDPSPTGYRTVEVRDRGQRVVAQLVPQLDIAVADILP